MLFRKILWSKILPLRQPPQIFHPRQTGEWHRSVMAHAAKSPLYQALEILIQESPGTLPRGSDPHTGYVVLLP